MTLDKTMDERIIGFVAQHHTTLGYGPTFREIGDAVGLSAVSAVAYRVRQLVRAGKLAQGPHGTPRTLRVAP